MPSVITPSYTALSFVKKIIHLLRLGLLAKKNNDSQTEVEKTIARHALAKMLGDAKGISMKIGQLFSDIDGNSEYQPLVEGVDPIPLKQMLSVLEHDLKSPFRKTFKSIDEAVSAASLGQVHFAELINGEKVAIKIQYSDIAQAIDTELRLIGLFPGIGPVKQWGFNIEEYKVNFRNNILRELDYLSEAKRQDYFSQAVCVEGLNIPKVLKKYCSQRVLVQSRASGVMIHEIVDWPKNDRVIVGEILLCTLFKSLFVAGEVHADPHAGNVFYSYDQKGKPNVTLLDYGCTVSVSEQRRLALLKLIISCRLKNQTNPLDYFVDLGFDAKKLSHISHSLPFLCHYLFKPFVSNQPLIIATWNLEKNISKLLGDKRWWFRSAGPADLLLLMRAFQGLTVQLQYLKVSLNWWDLLQRSVGDSIIQQAEAYTIPEVTVQNNVNKISFFNQAEKLCVAVFENGTTKVSVTLPADAALDLENIMPEDVTEWLNKSSSINLEQIMHNLRNNGLIAQVLFDFQNKTKRYKVWLE